MLARGRCGVDTICHNGWSLETAPALRLVSAERRATMCRVPDAGVAHSRVTAVFKVRSNDD